MKDIALICPAQASAIGELIMSQSLRTDDLFTLTYVPWASSQADIERLARSSDGAVVILSDRASTEELEKVIDPFVQADKPTLGLRVYPDDPVPEKLGEAGVTDLSQRAVSRFIDSLGQRP